jgi:hypothetical protein
MVAAKSAAVIGFAASWEKQLDAIQESKRVGNGRPQRWRRRQTMSKNANIMNACGMRGARWRKDASPSSFLT